MTIGPKKQNIVSSNIITTITKINNIAAFYDFYMNVILYLSKNLCFVM